MQDSNKLRDELMQQVYGPNLDEAKSGAEVLSLIKSLGQGMARDQALNGDLSDEQMAALLASEEYQRAALETALTFPYLDDAAKAEALRTYDFEALKNESMALHSKPQSDDWSDEDSSDTTAAQDDGAASVDDAAPGTRVPAARKVHYQSPFSYEFWELRNVQATTNVRSIYKSRGVSSRLAQLTPAAKYRGSRYAMAPELLAAVKELNARGLTLEEISTQVQARFKIQVSVNRLSSLLRYGLRELNEFNQRRLNPCYPIIYVDVVSLRMLTSANLLVEHPFYFIMGLDFKGDQELLKVFNLPKDYEKPGAQAKMWRRALQDLKDRGLIDPIYFVTGALQEFGEPLREIYPQAIYQRCISSMLDEALALAGSYGSDISASDFNDFTNHFRSLGSCKTLLECMKLFSIYERRWQGKFSGADRSIDFLRENFVFFEQYYAAEPAIRASLRALKPLDNIINNVRRAIRNDHSYMFCDVLHTLCRVLEIERYYTLKRRPVQWRRALHCMFDDAYTNKIISKYLSPDDVRLSERSVKRDLAKSRKLKKAESNAFKHALVVQEHMDQITSGEVPVVDIPGDDSSES